MNNYNLNTEIQYSLLAFFISLASSFLLFYTTLITEDEIFSNGIRLFFLSFLCYGTLIYLITRYAYFIRLKTYKPVDQKELENFSQNCTQSVTYLVPSYKEEISIVRKTLLSAALQDWQQRHVVLLIDDPPYTSNPQDLVNLNLTRELPLEIANILSIPEKHLSKLYRDHLNRVAKERTTLEFEKQMLSNGYREAAKWFKQQKKLESFNDHTDPVFLDLTFNARENELKKKAESIFNENLKMDTISENFLALSRIFSVKVSSFERKLFQNFSQSSNKAMNVNSYLSVMGGRFNVLRNNNQTILQQSEKGTLFFEDSPYIAVLDADTILTHDYSLNLIHEMEKAGHEKIAVIQTPYSAFPNPPGQLERAAGATTDLQYITHQGFTHFGATFWVGANAIVRKKALNEIVETVQERGYQIKRYIQDRTVIEDTESSIDLASKGWKLINYPKRLSYSTTPADFGSLLIQRRRWANGGLLILPKLFQYLFKAPYSLKKLHEFFYRFYYLFSLPALLFGALLTTFISNPSQKEILFCVLAMLPYLITYARDLKYNGYQYFDLFRVIALNLLLIPVNIAGVIKSCEQAFTGKQIPFSRTPKTQDRTHVPGIYLYAQLFLFLYSMYLSVNHALNQQWIALGYQLVTLLPLIYAMKVYIGFGNTMIDIAHSMKRCVRSVKLFFLSRTGERSCR